MSFHLTHRALCRVLAVSAVALLTGCGVPDQPTGRAAALPVAQNQTTTPLPTATLYVTNTPSAMRPTLSPEEATRVAWSHANKTAVANQDATAFARPPAPQDGPRPVYPTSKPQPVGILPCQSVDRERQFAAWNCWRTTTSTQAILVWAGGESGSIRKIGDPSRYREDDPTIQGGVDVCVTAYDAAEATCDLYWRPEKEGRLKIVAVTEPRLTLKSVTGSRYVFNVETRAWEAAPAVPVATATPLPTEVPPPTFTPLPTGPTATPAPVVTTAAVRPVLECVAPNGDGSFTAWFGSKNDNSATASIPLGAGNRFTPAPADRGQPVTFAPGRQVKTFGVAFDGTNLVWTLIGPDGKTRTATAARTSKACAP